MWANGRRLVIHAWTQAKAQFAALAAERDELQAENDQLRRDLANVRRQRDDAIEALLELRAVVRARQAAEQELVSFYRERDIERARAAERDPNAALN